MSEVNNDKIILYGHPTCPMMPAARAVLNGAKVDYHYINIHQDEAGRQRVREINDGYESVPTLVFLDGSTLTEPSTGELTSKLESLGYSVPLRARLIGYLPMLVIAAIILWGMLRLLGIL